MNSIAESLFRKSVDRTPQSNQRRGLLPFQDNRPQFKEQVKLAQMMDSRSGIFAVSPQNSFQLFPRKSGSSAVLQLMTVTSTDIGQSFNIMPNGSSAQVVGALKSISGNGWYLFDCQGTDVKVHGEKNILSSAKGLSAAPASFTVGRISFPTPISYAFTRTSALEATRPMVAGGWERLTGKSRSSGVKIGDYGSYGAVQHLEKVGDGLTGDHQPSGAAVKEAIRQCLYPALPTMLTRSMASNAYEKASTIVMPDVWHKAESRTYGGRNSKAQILTDAADLITASKEDWKKTVPGLKAEGFQDQEIKDIWDGLDRSRRKFFATGKGQWM